MIWTVGYVVVLSKVIATAIYWLSYYAVDYSAGFVRRGLAGQIVTIFPSQHYFPVSYGLMWGSFAFFCSGLAVVMWRIMYRGNRSERRLMTALIIPVLPFAVTFAVFGPRPELYAAGCLLLFATALTRFTTSRAALLLAAAFGVAIAVLALFHEAIPLEFALGSVLAISVLAVDLKPATRALCMSLAVLPGLVSTVVVTTFGRHDVTSELCARVPHGMVRDPWKVPSGRSIDYLLGRYESTSDYHDWVCERVIPYFGASFSAGVRSVVNLGLPALVGSFLHGLIVCAGTLWLIQFFTRVRGRDFLQRIRGGLWAPVMAAGFMIPIFASGVDWIRWWTIILINIAGTYLLFAAGRNEMETAVTRRDFKWFIGVVVLLACIPLSAVAGYFTQWVTV
ncbi:MAG: hypothetical protein ACR2JI_02705 [Mycobacterium sp.]